MEEEKWKGGLHQSFQHIDDPEVVGPAARRDERYDGRSQGNLNTELSVSLSMSSFRRLRENLIHWVGILLVVSTTYNMLLMLIVSS